MKQGFQNLWEGKRIGFDKFGVKGSTTTHGKKSPNILLEPTWMNLKAIQMGSNPNAKLNHHMNSYELAPSEVTRSSDKVKIT